MKGTKEIIILSALLLFYAACMINKTYSIQIPGYEVLLNAVDQNQYVSLVTNSPEKVKLVQHTTINYFGVLPSWTSHIILFLSFGLLVRLYLLMNKPKHYNN